jgi:hypothetical protein
MIHASARRGGGGRFGGSRCEQVLAVGLLHTFCPSSRGRSAPAAPAAATRHGTRAHTAVTRTRDASSASHLDGDMESGSELLDPHGGVNQPLELLRGPRRRRLAQNLWVMVTHPVMSARRAHPVDIARSPCGGGHRWSGAGPRGLRFGSRAGAGAASVLQLAAAGRRSRWDFRVSEDIGGRASVLKERSQTAETWFALRLPTGIGVLRSAPKSRSTARASSLPFVAAKYTAERLSWHIDGR